MRDLSWIGVWLLVAGAVVIVMEGALVAVWSVLLVKRTRALAERLQSERTQLDEVMRRLRLALDETERLWRPYSRAIGWLRHPLTIALLQSYVRRRGL